MEYVGEIALSESQERILDSVMPGGEKWDAYKERGEGCLGECPYYRSCRGSGPDKVCSDSWRKAEANTDVLGVLFHVLNNFEYYNQNEIQVDSASNDLADIRLKLSVALEEIGNEDIEEGTPLTRMHRFRERNSAAAAQFKREAASKGNLVCEACGVDYLKLYKEAALRVVECHHSVPLSSKKHTGRTKRSDLVLLCATCHRLAHSRSEPIPVAELREIVSAAKNFL